MKKGQVTLFVILGIVIIMVFSLVWYVRGESLKGFLSFSRASEFPEVENQLQECLHAVAADGVYVIGAQGGYSHTEKLPTVRYNEYAVPLYFSAAQEKFFPALEDMQRELGTYVAEHTGVCIGRIEGYEVRTGTPEATAEVHEKKILVNVNPALAVTKENRTRIFKNMKQEVVFSLPEYYNVIKEVVDEQGRERNAMPFGFLATINMKDLVAVDTVQISNNTMVYLFFFNNTLKSEEFVWAFGAEYDWA